MPTSFAYRLCPMLGSPADPTGIIVRLQQWSSALLGARAWPAYATGISHLFCSPKTVAPIRLEVRQTLALPTPSTLPSMSEAGPTARACRYCMGLSGIPSFPYNSATALSHLSLYLLCFSYSFTLSPGASSVATAAHARATAPRTRFSGLRLLRAGNKIRQVALNR